LFCGGIWEILPQGITFLPSSSKKNRKMLAGVSSLLSRDLCREAVSLEGMFISLTSKLEPTEQKNNRLHF
jgi:hypothetical protein